MKRALCLTFYEVQTVQKSRLIKTAVWSVSPRGWLRGGQVHLVLAYLFSLITCEAGICTVWNAKKTAKIYVRTVFKWNIRRDHLCLNLFNTNTARYFREVWINSLKAAILIFTVFASLSVRRGVFRGWPCLSQNQAGICSLTPVQVGRVSGWTSHLPSLQQLFVFLTPWFFTLGAGGHEVVEHYKSSLSALESPIRWRLKSKDCSVASHVGCESLWDTFPVIQNWKHWMVMNFTQHRQFPLHSSYVTILLNWSPNQVVK